ncbi:uncharacterized protein Dana_GF13202 [Drosophila ananassae]|uniref:Uncharacterized protein n=1 Tax=Drosophila ananassae TaxID=7217 RepID=B3MHU4_DROAN|nr:uncharacterized protein LOC6496045 [Drosophila ananassae]EDV36931.2 uncharacterized protein Dana_GF13202 [Drosophila ananassae]
MLKLETKFGIIFSGILSMGFAIIYLLLKDGFYWRAGLFDLRIHTSSLQILASIVLIIGAIRQNYNLLVPWMFTTALFLYLMVYLTIVTLIRTQDCAFLPLVVPFSAYLCCALVSVRKAFDRMRNDDPPAYANLLDKKVFISHI